MAYHPSGNTIVQDYTNTPEFERKHFNPYSKNGGGIVAIAGADYVTIGADTRLSVDYSIINRNQEKLFKLSNTSVLGASGCWADVLTVSRLLRVRMDMYKMEHNRDMSTPSAAQMLSALLYYKRFFPYAVLNVLAGLDENGAGCVFNFDCIGHCVRSNYTASGTAGPLLQPLFDNQIGQKNMKNCKETYLRKNEAISLLKDGFTCAAERDVYTGNDVQIITITRKGVHEEIFHLRKD